MEENPPPLDYARPSRQRRHRRLIPIVLALWLVATGVWVYWRYSDIGVFDAEFKAAPLNWRQNSWVIGAIAATAFLLYGAHRRQTPLKRFLLAVILLFGLGLILLIWWLSLPRGGLQATLPAPAPR